MNSVTAELHTRPYDYDDEIITATRRDRQPYRRVYVPSMTTVVLGRGSRPDVELHVDACIEDKVPILRRYGGGCAVVVEPGNVVVSVVLPCDGIGHHSRYFDQLTGWLIEGLGKIGVSGVRREGISDLAVGDRKVAGASIYHTLDYLYYAATLLVEPRVELMERYLKHPPREPDYRQGRSHRDFIGRMSCVCAFKNSEALSDELRGVLNVEDLLALVHMPAR